MKINSVVKTSSAPETMPRLRITLAEIAEVKERHILRNLLYTPDEAGHILGKKARSVLDLVKSGKLIAADDSASRGGRPSSGLRITAESLGVYRQSIIIPPEKWSE